MTLKLIFTIFFILLFVYSLIRPFSGLTSKLFLSIGSLLGLISVTESQYTNAVAEFLGISSGRDLYLYLSLVTIFLFIFYSWEKFKRLEARIVKLTRALALKNAKHNNPNQ